MAKKSFKVTLPGSLYQKNNRWWWKVKLPGETRLKARGLKPEGKHFATADRDEAEELARNMWESAIRADVEAAARAQAREKAKASAEEMERLKADTDQAIAGTRAEVMDMITKAKAQCEEKLRLSDEAVARAEELAAAEAEKRARAEELAATEAEKRALAEAQLNELLSGIKSTGTCDCCGKQEIPEDQLAKIDSGQLLCPDCLSALRG